MLEWKEVKAITVENNEVEMVENQFFTDKHVKVCLHNDFDVHKMTVKPRPTSLCNKKSDLETSKK